MKTRAPLLLVITFVVAFSACRKAAHSSSGDMTSIAGIYLGEEGQLRYILAITKSGQSDFSLYHVGEDSSRAGASGPATMQGGQIYVAGGRFVVETTQTGNGPSKITIIQTHLNVPGADRDVHVRYVRIYSFPDSVW